MTTRREFLQVSLTASALPIAVAFATPAGLPATGREAIDMAVFDERFSDSVRFAKQLERFGVASRSIRGDMTGLWVNTLEPRWSRRPVPIAGLTRHGPLFCLERLAWDYGMRVIFRGEHVQTADARIQHSIKGPVGVVGPELIFAADRIGWADLLASLVVRCHVGPATSSKICWGSRGPISDLEIEPLFSWVIAPVSGRRSSI